jgi:hypothetical protein
VWFGARRGPNGEEGGGFREGKEGWTGVLKGRTGVKGRGSASWPSCPWGSAQPVDLFWDLLSQLTPFGDLGGFPQTRRLDVGCLKAKIPRAVEGVKKEAVG